MSAHPAKPGAERRTTDDWLRRGQSFEATGSADALAEAVACYDRAIMVLQSRQPRDAATTRELAVAWMNRGNALQKHDRAADVRTAVPAYDRAIELLSHADPGRDATTANRLGAAWLNRGHALLQLGDPTGAVASFEQALGWLSTLPVDREPVFRLNLAGAQANLAQALLDQGGPDHLLAAHAAAGEALRLAAREETARAGFAEVGLKARRTLCEIVARWLVENRDPQREATLLAAASDAADSGMALARRWEALDVPLFRPLATRLFRFGCAYYRRHQPQFLADFVLENLDPAHTSDACPGNREWRDIALETLAATRHELRTQHPLVDGDPASRRRLQALDDIEAAHDTVTRLLSERPPSPA